ncbi:hypothetical protein [Azospirillum tabaci]|uniref:hypothetical protein n=1 Tax=Azospirillum tabaci TaxID=2752310 RepID=UPI001660CF32|nr:hypothetical protein [Azospirillum tabaci]
MNKVVRLLRPYRSNNAGEVCGFSEQEAASLVASGCAVDVGVGSEAQTQTSVVALGAGGDGEAVQDAEGGGSGGEGEEANAAPPAVSATGRAIRHAGRGMYHVVAADGTYVTPAPVPKAEAEALAAQG